MTDGLIFRASFQGLPASIGHADKLELVDLPGSADDWPLRDELDMWSLMAVRRQPPYRTAVHALGWRRGIANVWITSPLIKISSLPMTVQTRSGHRYSLGKRDRDELQPALLDHLRHALATWGFEAVVAEG
jgi:hypothetical protein